MPIVLLTESIRAAAACTGAAGPGIEIRCSGFAPSGDVFYLAHDKVS